jgi:AbrB family looped-hinge helix DNA binding protein
MSEKKVLERTMSAAGALPFTCYCEGEIAAQATVIIAMTITLKPRTEITVPKSIRRKAGIKPGGRVEFSVSGRVINIIPRLSSDELADYLELQDPKARRALEESNADIAAGRVKAAEDLLQPSKRKKRGTTSKE